MATNSKNKNKSEEKITALDSILNDLSDLGLGSEADIEPETSSFGLILNHLVHPIPAGVLENQDTLGRGSIDPPTL